MHFALTEQTAPTTEPVTLAEVKTHCRIDISDDDTHINSLIKAARQYCEGFTNRSFINTTWIMRLDAFPSWEIMMPKPLLSSITSVVYLDTANASQTLAAATYSADIYSEPGRLSPAYGYSWPSTYSTKNAVTITYVAGYGASATYVPQAIKQAILLLVGHWYENRESVITGTIVSAVPVTVDNLLWMYRVPEIR